MTKRLLYGKFPSGTEWGLRCSKPGYDVTTNPPDPEHMIFDSSWGAVLPIHYRSGVIGLGSGSSITVPYTALPYTPFCFVLTGFASSGLFWHDPSMPTTDDTNGLDFGFGASTSSASAKNRIGQTIYFSFVIFRLAV